MHDILIGLLFFCLAVVSHLLWCRWRKHKELKMGEFCLIAFICLCFSLKMLVSPPLAAIHGSWEKFWHMPLAGTMIILYILSIPVYLMFYFNTKVESPSQRILLIIKKKKEITYPGLSEYVTDIDFVVTRLMDLKESKCIRLEKEGYCLLPRGLVVARLLTIYEKISGREMGG